MHRMHRSRSWLALLIVLPILVVAATRRADATPNTLRLIVESLTELEPADVGADCTGDYRIHASIGTADRTSPLMSFDQPGCNPTYPNTLALSWMASVEVDPGASGVPVTLALVEADGGGVSVVDVNPVVGVRELHLVVDPGTGRFVVTGPDGGAMPVPGVPAPGATEAVVEGNGDVGDIQAALHVRVLPMLPDSDGDGLPDEWETHGYDADGDTLPDVFLPEMGADPTHKDVFVMLDVAELSMVSKAGIDAIIHAFADAPVANPDGTTGIRLHVDSGALVDPQAGEGRPQGTCANGDDDDLDGLADALDPDCVGTPYAPRYLDTAFEGAPVADCTDAADGDADGLVDGEDPDCVIGEDGGAPGVLAAPGVCGLDAAFYARKGLRYLGSRAPVFRYALVAPAEPGCAAGGGSAEWGGNDLVAHAADPGTLMQLLGATLGLRRGGPAGADCAPNHLSVMNTAFQIGIERDDGGRILDFSPPRREVRGGARSTTLASSVLDESALVEAQPVDPTDHALRTVFVDGGGRVRTVGLDEAVDWDGDGGIDADPVMVDVTALAWANLYDGCPPAAFSNLVGVDEWSLLALPVRLSVDRPDGPTRLAPAAAPAALTAAIATSANRTDLELSATAVPATIAPGRSAAVTVTVHNAGPNPADLASVLVDPGSGVVVTGGADSCPAAPGGLRCYVGPVPAGGSLVLPLTVRALDDPAYPVPGPRSLTLTAAHAGPDPDPSDDAVVVALQIVDEADLDVRSVQVPSAPGSPGPMGPTPDVTLTVGQPGVVTVVTFLRATGISVPVDATLHVEVSGAVGVGEVDEPVPALAAGRRVTTDVALVCAAPGLHTLVVRATISADRTSLVDTDTSNDMRTTTATVWCSGWAPPEQP